MQSVSTVLEQCLQTIAHMHVDLSMSTCYRSDVRQDIPSPKSPVSGIVSGLVRFEAEAQHQARREP